MRRSDGGISETMMLILKLWPIRMVYFKCDRNNVDWGNVERWQAGQRVISRQLQVSEKILSSKYYMMTGICIASMTQF
jgi:hypothetical protein